MDCHSIAFSIGSGVWQIPSAGVEGQHGESDLLSSNRSSNCGVFGKEVRQQIRLCSFDNRARRRGDQFWKRGATRSTLERPGDLADEGRRDSWLSPPFTTLYPQPDRLAKAPTASEETKDVIATAFSVAATGSHSPGSGGEEWDGVYRGA